MNKLIITSGLILIALTGFTQTLELDIHKNKLADFIKIEKNQVVKDYQISQIMFLKKELPTELRNENKASVFRKINGKITNDSIVDK
jgi:hypothetical protein